MPVPSLPAGSWQVDYGVSRCSLAHTYRAGEKEIVLAFERGLSQKSVLVRISYPITEKRRSGDGKAVVSIGDMTTEVDWRASRTSALEVTTFRVDSSLIADAPSRPILTVSRDKREPIALDLSGLARGWSSLEACRADMLAQWNVDPKEDEKVAQEPRAIGDESMFISMNDYPPSALRAKTEGTTNLLFTVGISGRVTACRIIESSGAAELDKAACAALYGRARYRPAIGRDGVAMGRHIMRRMAWRLPH